MDAPSQSPLPSPRSRFTVTPVAVTTPEIELPDTGDSAPAPGVVLSSNNNADSTKEDASTATDYTSLIRSSPSKVIVGFDVLTTWAPPSLIAKQYRFPILLLLSHTHMVHLLTHRFIFYTYT